MAQLTINQCQTCSKILAPGVTECPKCHTQHAIQPRVVNPLRFTPAEVADYRAEFQEQVAACPKDSNAQFAMGLTYLGLRNYELADEHLVKAVQLTPSNPDVYYYTALAMFHHRSVANLSKAEMERIEQWLHTAVQMQPKRKYLILQMVIRQGMSSMGINVDTDKATPAELLNQARQTAQEEDELFEIEQHVLVTDEKTRFLLDKLTNGLAERSNTDRYESTILDDNIRYYDQFCDLPRGEEKENTVNMENVERLQEVEERRSFFSHMHMPKKPVHVEIPGFANPLYRAGKWAVGLLILWLITAAIAKGAEWFRDDCPVHIDTVEERLERRVTDKMTKARIAELREEAQEEYEKDSIEDSHYMRLLYSYKESGDKHYTHPFLSEEEISALPGNAEYFGVSRSWKGLLGLFFYYSPLVLWLMLTYGFFKRRVKDRKEAKRKNQELEDNYKKDVDIYNNRPSIADYKSFYVLYSGPNKQWALDKGDFVAEALRQAHISELDVKNGNGKIFFSCYMMDVDGDGKDCKDPSITLERLIIRVCVAMRDSIVYMHAVWDSTQGDFPIFDQERLLYSQIANFRNVASYSRLEVISHSNSVLATIVYAFGDYPSMFTYQGLDPDDELTYNTTRTSDFTEFYNSVVKMHTAYVKG